MTRTKFTAMENFRSQYRKQWSAKFESIAFAANQYQKRAIFRENHATRDRSIHHSDTALRENYSERTRFRRVGTAHINDKPVGAQLRCETFVLVAANQDVVHCLAVRQHGDDRIKISRRIAFEPVAAVRC